MKELKELLCEGLTEKSWKHIRQFSLPLQGFVEVALQEPPVIAPFVEHFKVAIMRGSHWQFLTVLWKVPLKIAFP